MNPENRLVVDVQNLAKTFPTAWGRPDVQAVRDVSFRMHAGSITALVGPNGAGKTTAIYALQGLIRPDSGTLRVFGLPAGSEPARARTGFQPEHFFTYGFQSAEAVLHFYAALSRLPRERAAGAVSRQLSRLGLAEAGPRRTRGFSKGMTQRLGLAQALLHEPDLLILDEPTSGLDPEGRKLVTDLILEEKARGATILLSSHILSDVERICDHIVIIQRGAVAFSGALADLRETSDEWEIEVGRWTPAARDAAAGLVVHEEVGKGSTVRCCEKDKPAVLSHLLAAGAELGTIRRRQSLEDLYMKYAGGDARHE